MIRWLMILITLSSTAYCQQLVEGTVVDGETGNPVPFASIGVVGTSRGTSSNLNGQFSISVKEPVSLMVTCIGYESRTINSIAELKLIKLKPMATELEAITITDKRINARKIVRKAFAGVTKNYNTSPFLQKFFYRHYCKDNDAYGRLIEASVDVWKSKGYRSLQKEAGAEDEIRITQLRRSLDKTIMAQGHEPILLGYILETDIVGYQAFEKSEHLMFYSNVSNLKADMEDYTFDYKGITSYDGQEVYKITYAYKKDSALTTSGKYKLLAQSTGSLFITTDTYAIIKTEETKTYEQNTIRSSAYYRKYADYYYPYHFILDGKSYNADNSTHTFHIELMSVEVKNDATEKFTGNLPGKEDLLKIPYDSVFWTSNTILKTTPLEDDIIRDLGGGTSLNEQFFRYHQYELNVHNGGTNGDAKFNWFREDSKNDRILYLIFWSSDFDTYVKELELAKRIHRQYWGKITFVFISVDDNEKRWQETLQKYNLSSDGIINYRVGSNSQTAKSFRVEAIPAFVLIARNGSLFDMKAKRPSDPLLQKDFDLLIEQQ